MITRIAEVDSFGILNGFKWDSSLSEFNKFNIIYGWNYSGKTTLSRVFSNFEFSQKHEDYQSCTSKIVTDDGSVYDCSSFGFTTPIRVFNTDFVDKNLKWRGMIEPIFMIGAENIALQEQLSNLRDKIEEKQLQIKDISEKAGSATTLQNDQISAKAREFKNTLSVPDYNKRNLDRVISEVGQNILILPDDTVQNLIDTYRSTDKKPKIEEVQAYVPDIEKNLKRAQVLLKTKVVTKTIEKLKQNPELSSWVRQGKDIHKGKTICEFCGNPLEEDLIDRLNDHFSDEYEKHIQSIKALINEIENENISCELPDEAKFYSAFSENFGMYKDNINSAISDYNKNIDAVIRALKSKTRSPFDEVEFPTLSDISQIKAAVDFINSNIRKHNERTQNFEKRQHKAYH